VSVASSARSRPSASKPTLHWAWKAVPLAGDGHVLRPGQAQPDRSPGQRRSQSGDGGEAVRLHLLAAEAAAHAQALHGHLVAPDAEHVGDDLLGLRRVLGAALHEHLAALVDVREGAVGLEVEVLLAGELQLAAEDVGRGVEAGLHVTTLQVRLPALEAPRRDRLPDGHQGGQRLEVHLDRLRAEPGGLDRLGEHPADGVAVEHDLGGEERLVVLDPGVVDARDVGGGEDPDHAGDGVGRLGPEGDDPGVRLEHLDGPGVQDVLGPPDQVVGVERLSRDVERGTLVRDGQSDDRVRRPLGERTHAPTSWGLGFSAYSLRRAWPSIAAR
jgi:hypothetical protein